MKRGKDYSDVFAVFKKGSFMENASFWEKLKYWFRNVYWFHFKAATIGVIIAAILGGALIHDIATREYRDLDYILAGSVFADVEQMGALSDILAGYIEVEDENPDDDVLPKATVGHQMLSTESIMGSGDQAQAIDEYNAASIEKISVSMADDEVLLYFFDKKYADWYAKQGAFEPLSSFGIESDNDYYVKVSDLTAIREIGINHRDGIYAGIKIKTPARMKNERIVRKYENAGAALRGLLSEK